MWDYFDKALCLTTTNATDLETVTQGFKMVGLNHVKLCPVAPRIGINRARPENTLLDILKYKDNTTTSVTREVAKNHISLIQKAYDDPETKVLLLLEDDACFDPVMTTRYLPRIVQWMKKSHWTAFNFGAIAFPYIPVRSGVGLARRPLLMHAHALTREGMLRVLRAFCHDPTQHLELLVSNAMDGRMTHVAMPPICFQLRPPAMFQHGIEKLPKPLSTYIETLTFKQFCELYYRATHTALLVGVLTLLLFYTSSSN